MFRMIDSTLNYINEDNTIFQKEDALQFIGFIRKAGIMDLMISKHIYQILKMDLGNEIRFYLELDIMDRPEDFPGIHVFFQRETNDDRVIPSYQINDIREILQLRNRRYTNGILISGLDDLICHDFKNKFRQIRENAGTEKILLRPENNCSCATAIAVEFVLHCGGDIITSFLGIGNLAATEQVIMALRYTGQFRMKQNYEILIDMKNLCEATDVGRVGDKMPIVGETIFDVESGIHVDGVLKNSSNYECVSPKMLGRTRNILLGKHSGKVSVEYKRKQLRIPSFTDSQAEQILAGIKETSIRHRRNITDEEFIALVQRVVG